MSDTKAARRYSEALFRLAAETGVLDEVAADLRAIDALARGSAAFADVAVNPRVSAGEKTSAFEALFGASARPLTLRFLRFLVERRRMGALGAICGDFETRYLDHIRVKVVSVLSAHPLSDAQTAALRQKLSTRLGCEIRLREQVDPSLLAGLRIRIGDLVEDYSASALIQRFHKAVLNA